MVHGRCILLLAELASTLIADYNASSHTCCSRNLLSGVVMC